MALGDRGTVGRIRLALVADGSGLGRSIEREVDGASGAVGSSFKRLAGIATAAFAGFQIGSKIKDAILAGSDLEETLSKTNVIFGESTKGATDFADDMAKRFGLVKNVMLDAAGNIGLVGKAAGLTQGEAADLGVGFAKLAADASSFFNVPLDVALEKIRSGLVGESEPLRAFGVLLSEEAVKAEAAAMGIANMGDKLTEAQKVQARASLITKGLADATGDLERTSGSFANRLRMLQGRAANFAADIGRKLIPVALKLFDFMEGPLARVATRVGAALSKTFWDVTSVVGRFIDAVRDPDITSDGVWGVIERIAKAVRVAIDSVRLFVGSITGAGAQVDKAMSGGWMNAVITAGAVTRQVFETVRAVVVRVAPIVIGAISSGFGALNGFARDNEGTIRQWGGRLLEVIQAVRSGVGPVFAAIGAALVAVGRWVSDNRETFREWATTLATLGRRIGSDLLTVLRGAGVVLTGVGRFVRDNKDTWAEWGRSLLGLVQPILETLGAGWEAVRAIFAVGVAGVRRIWDEWGGHLWSQITRVVGAIIDIIEGGLRIVRGVFQAVSGLLTGDWGRLWDGIKNILGGAWDVIRTWVGAGVGTLLEWFAALPGKALGLLADLPGKMLRLGQDIIEGLIRGILDRAGKLLSTIWDKITGPLNAVRRWIDPGSPSRLTTGWGRSISEGLALGVTQRAGLVDRAMGRLQGSVATFPAVALPATGVPTVGMPPLGNAQLLGGGTTVSQRIDVTVNNPTAEPASESLAKAARRVGADLGGW